jgi:hypothetical protein
MISTLKREVSPIAETLLFGELQFATTGSGGVEGSIFVSSSSGQRLFRVDLTKFGSAIESEIHSIESQSVTVCNENPFSKGVSLQSIAEIAQCHIWTDRGVLARQPQCQLKATRTNGEGHIPVSTTYQALGHRIEHNECNL